MMTEHPPIFLSQLILDPRSVEVQRCIADCHRLHQFLMRGFPAVMSDNPRDALEVLFRPELDLRTGAITALVQSIVEPDWGLLASGPSAPIARSSVKPIDQVLAAITAGDRLRFRLRANPTKRLAHFEPDGSLARRPDGRNKPGPRVPLITEEDQLAWLERKLDAAGGALRQATARPDRFGGRRQTGRKPGIGTITLDAVVYEGVLTVADPERFRDALVTGVGPGKAYGFGLLSIGPDR